MGLQIQRKAAEAIFARALELARSDAQLPEIWLERARRVSNAKSMTFVPVLGTALLAKATDRRVDALSLRESAGHKGYSARSLAKEVLVPCCIRAGVNIRNTGAEPLNNQPFLRAEHISLDLEVKPNARTDFQYLVDTVTQVDFLEDAAALAALAAFLRVRLEATATLTLVHVGVGILALPALESALDSYLAGDSEGGKVGQAVVAATWDLVFTNVRTKRINDPSMKWPGDVGVFDEGGGLLLSAEVKQRPVTETEVLLFAQRLSANSVYRGVVAALAQGKVPLDVQALRMKIHEQFGVDMVIERQASALVAQAVRFSVRDLPKSLRDFPGILLLRLKEMEVSTVRRQEWAARFEVASHETP
ncbi:restriction endonuclease, SacI family [Myxococcus sp. CA051A]|uniref:restriction endonuclease, SacI family n=1 Tax=Myxococcus sp. CA051A TaxID=2741739 RepID=UPI00157B520F|nr:restriction endonuclease, SacI family [Myxococcus sp. CA051A]NTX63819.1 restriction endonuclease, SacI family [Myxococcus sp. CA051A]